MVCNREKYQKYLSKMFRDIKEKQQVRRDYTMERECYELQPERRAKHASRLRLRAAFIKKGIVDRHDGMELHHRDHNAMNNQKRNILVLSEREHTRLHQEERRVKKKNLSTV